MARKARGSITLTDISDGDQGAPGSRGAGRWNIPVTTLPTSSATAEAAWNTSWTGRPGANVIGDQAWFYTGTESSPSGQSVWVSTGATTWVEQTEVIDGDLLVAGTVTLDRLAATAASGSRVVINGNGMAVFNGSETLARVIVGNLEGTF